MVPSRLFAEGSEHSNDRSWHEGFQTCFFVLLSSVDFRIKEFSV